MSSLHLPNSAPDLANSAVIKVFGIGGGGCNALEHMLAADIKDVEFKCINTDTQALKRFPPEYVLEIGNGMTKGLGAGANPEVGGAAAEESREQITEAIGDADMLFVTAGMGGGTGTGAVSTIAKIAREMGVLTVAVVTEPFAFEGPKRKNAAVAGLETLRDCADSMIVVPNENLLSYLGPNISLVEAFAAANDVVTKAVQSIAELITTSGLINVDFADVKTVMGEMGHAIMSTGTGMGEHRAEEAALAAIKSPLLNNVDLKAAKGILANITSSSDLSMGEFQAVGDIIRQIAADDATVVVGTVFDDSLGHEMKVTVVATGLKPPKNEVVAKDNDELAAKLTQPIPTASEKAAADAVSAQATAEAERIAAEAERATAEAERAAAEAQEKARAEARAEANARATDVLASRQKQQKNSTAVDSSNTGTYFEFNNAKPAVEKQTPPPVQSAVSATDSSASAGDNQSSVAVKDVCIICGCTNGKHLQKCPWASAETDAKATVKEPANIADSLPTDTGKTPTATKTPAVSKDIYKQVGLAAVAATVLASAGTWYLMSRDKSADTIVKNSPAVEETGSDSIGGLRSVAPYTIPTLVLEADEIEAAVKAGDNLIPEAAKKDARIPALDTGSPATNSEETEVTELDE